MVPRLRSLILFLWLGLVAGTGVNGATVIVVSSERGGPYLEAFEALAADLERGGLPRAELMQVTLAEFLPTTVSPPKLYVALGAEAALELAKAEPHAPVLCALLPRASFELALKVGRRRSSSQFSALVLDQPLQRQLELIRLALPEARHLGLLWGPQSQWQAGALKSLAQTQGFDVVEAVAADDERLFSGLSKILERADLLLALADPQIYNSNNLQNILLASFRARVPMVAFSPAYVRAGALVALHVSPAQVGQQAAAMARGVLMGRLLPSSPAFSQEFSVSVNEYVARSLGLALDADALRLQLRRREAAP